ncbi:hypothetical protein [methane-oxidizing endosymbiont of Gigantopelta aegis]|uniref:hypothetical protein n=1 Tax=methane-oxidizing endosymbiont of Gigantopelta aegis TaxID=2794938 RepID=UPI0018DDEC4E|nr:hypothetical protein [methane-oxidizing endosymbiont of Gigantopelta aegis]
MNNTPSRSSLVLPMMVLKRHHQQKINLGMPNFIGKKYKSASSAASFLNRK